MEPGSKLMILHADDINSDYGNDSELENKRNLRNDLVYKEKTAAAFKGNKQEVNAEYSKEEFRRERLHVLTLDAYSRHKKYINDYLLYYGGSTKDFKRDCSRDKTDFDVIKEHHKFLWDDEELANTWEKKLAKKYYDKLFKEYCIADLSLYKHNKIAMRWRIENEVVKGKGQFSCGEKKCEENEGLKSWEVNFAYMEEGVKQNALVKLRLCTECSYKLNYKHKHKEGKKLGKRKHYVSSDDVIKNDGFKDEVIKDDDDVINDDKSKIPKFDEKSVKETGKSKSKESEDNVWLNAEPEMEEKSRDEEFDDYFQDMFL